MIFKGDLQTETIPSFLFFMFIFIGRAHLSFSTEYDKGCFTEFMGNPEDRITGPEFFNIYLNTSID